MNANLVAHQKSETDMEILRRRTLKDSVTKRWGDWERLQSQSHEDGPGTQGNQKHIALTHREPIATHDVHTKAHDDT